MPTVIVNIGRNIGTTPMSPRRWRAFRAEVGMVLESACGDLYTRDAVGKGGWDDGLGWVPEASAVWVGAIAPENLPDLKLRLASLLERFHQDAIAVTVGDTEMVSL